MKSAKSIALGLLCAGTLFGLLGCHYNRGDYNDIQVSKTAAPKVAAIFKTPVGPEDRYAYALDEDKFWGNWGNTVLIMANLDEDGIVTAKYYWHSVPRPLLPFWRMDTWEIALETQIAPAELQQYTATMGPREEAMLEYFGRLLFDTSRHFEHLNEVFGITGSMNQILVRAASEYNMRADKQTLLSEDGFAFDGGIHGNKCTMKLAAVDERQGIYTVVLKGYRCEGLILVLNRGPLLRLNGLVQTIGPTAPRHRTSGKFVNNHHFTIADDIVDIAVIEHVGPQGCIEVVHQADMAGVVETLTLTNQTGFSK